MVVFNLNMKAQELGLALEDITKEVKANLESAVGSIASMAYEQGIMYTQQRLNKTRLQYLNAFKKVQLGPNSYLIYLEEDTNYLEQGYSSYDMKPGLLNGPKSRQSKDGGRYNIIPFFHSPQAATNTPEAANIQRDLQSAIKQYKLNRVFKGPNGKPLEGIVARVKGKDLSANLQGLVKTQKVMDKKVQSQFLTFRVVSTKSKAGSWIHPGWKGAHVFRDLESWTERKIDEVLRVILS